MAAKAGDRKKCPKCPRTVPLQDLGRGLVWPPHKPRRGPGDNCPQSGEPYQED